QPPTTTPFPYTTLFRSRLPVAAPLRLETKGCQRAVVGAASRDAGREDIGVREEVGRHEGAVAVSGDADALGVGDAHRVEFLDRGAGGLGDLFDVRVVGRLR